MSDPKPLPADPKPVEPASDPSTRPGGHAGSHLIEDLPQAPADRPEVTGVREVMQGEDIITYIAYCASNKVLDQTQTSTARWRAGWTAAVALFGVLGYSNISDTVAGSAKREIKAELDLEIASIKADVADLRTD